MTTVVTHGNVATISAEILSALGIKEGTRLEWTDAGSGTIVVKRLPSRSDRARALMGGGCRCLTTGADPMADLLKERIAEDSDDDTSLRRICDPGSLSR